MLQFRWRVAQGIGWGVAWFCVNCCGVTYSSEYRLCFWRKPHIMLVICQFYHKVKAKQMGFDPLSSLDRPQPWNRCCFSNLWRQTSKLNLVVVSASTVCLIIRLFKTQWVCSKAGHKQRCLVQGCPFFHPSSGNIYHPHPLSSSVTVIIVQMWLH